ncbi:MAG TPA: hypothetical protein VFE53_05680 [Mucilaginibacter sp.]|nr:hypothetical protein [Mucilaginibacter sp.]
MKKIFIAMLAVACFSVHARGQNTGVKTDPNAINLTDKGNSYRLISIGDKLPRLFVNDREVPAARLNDYAPIIDKMQNELWTRQKKAGQISDAEKEQQVNNIVADLVSQKIILSAAALLSFRLDGGGFVVNGKKQAFDVYTRFKRKFITSPDKVYQFNN